MSCTYPEASVILRLSARQLRRIVSEHHLAVDYRRIGLSPRKHAVLPKLTMRRLQEIILAVK